MLWEQELIILGRVALAMVCGGVIGVEREWANKPAGFRTHMLIAGAAALLVSLADIMVMQGNLASEDGSTVVRSDPIRVVEAIVTGLGFIGAGTIFRARDSERIEGLTTAASILLVGSIGIAVGLERYVLALGMTLLSLVVIGLIGALEQLTSRKRKNPK